MIRVNLKTAKKRQNLIELCRHIVQSLRRKQISAVGKETDRTLHPQRHGALFILSDLGSGPKPFTVELQDQRVERLMSLSQ